MKMNGGKIHRVPARRSEGVAFLQGLFRYGQQGSQLALARVLLAGLDNDPANLRAEIHHAKETQHGYTL